MAVPKPVPKPVPGQSNDPDPGRRTLENALIREMRMRARMSGMGYPTKASDAKIKKLKKKLY